MTITVSPWLEMLIIPGTKIHRIIMAPDNSEYIILWPDVLLGCLTEAGAKARNHRRNTGDSIV